MISLTPALTFSVPPAPSVPFRATEDKPIPDHVLSKHMPKSIPSDSWTRSLFSSLSKIEGLNVLYEHVHALGGIHVFLPESSFSFSVPPEGKHASFWQNRVKADAAKKDKALQALNKALDDSGLRNQLTIDIRRGGTQWWIHHKEANFS